MSDPRAHASLPGEASRVYLGRVGETYPAAEVDPDDYIVDPDRFDSEGDWAFCRFTSSRVPAVRFGYQLGSFNIGPDAGQRDASLLQLHLEVMTSDRGLLWIPTGRFPGELLDSSSDSKDVRLAVGGDEILRISGWPQMSWWMRSDDDEIEVSLDVLIDTVTVLPDCLLPHCVFAMWETMGRTQGHVRIGSERIPVEGQMFFDHTRVRHVRHAVSPRRMYLYTTLALDDGGGLFGYEAIDDTGSPIDYYCFGVHVDASGRGTFLPDATVSQIGYDADGIPSTWRLDWAGDEMTVEATVSAQAHRLGRGWGGPSAPSSRADWSILPLVLDSDVRLTRQGATTEQTGRGLAEYFDADRRLGSD